MISSQIHKAVEVLKNGGIVIFPTDTAFGIGCRIDDEKSIERLFKIRRRPESQAVPVLVSSLEMASEYVQNIPSEVQEKLIKKYWPGALTIVLQSKVDKVPGLVRGGGNTLGVRMPDHKTTLSIIEGLGVPLLGPSANFHGDPTPYEFQSLSPELVKLVDFVVHGQTSTGKVSTVIDVTQKSWEVLREGAIKLT